MSVASHKQVHERATSEVVCAMPFGRYLKLRGRGSPSDESRLERRKANVDTHKKERSEIERYFSFENHIHNGC